MPTRPEDIVEAEVVQVQEEAVGSDEPMRPSKGLQDRLITYDEASDAERAQMDKWRATLAWQDPTTIVRFGVSEMDSLAGKSREIVEFFLENDPRKHESTIQSVSEGIRARLQALADEGLISGAGRDVVVDGMKGTAKTAGALVAWTGNAIAGATNAVLTGWSRKKKQRTQVDINLQGASIRKALDEVDGLSKQLEKTEENLVEAFGRLQDLMTDNLVMFEKTELLIAAAQETVREWRDEQMPALQARAEETGRESDARMVKRMDRSITTLDRRINDMLALRFECAKQVVVLHDMEDNYSEWLTQVTDQRATGQVRAMMHIAMSALMKVANDAKIAVGDQQEFLRQLNDQFHEAHKETTESLVESRNKGVVNYAELQDSARKTVQVLTYRQSEDRKYVARLSVQREQLLTLGSSIRDAHATLQLTVQKPDEAELSAAAAPAQPAGRTASLRAPAARAGEDIIDAEVTEVTKGPAKPRRMATPPRP